MNELTTVPKLTIPAVEEKQPSLTELIYAAVKGGVTKESAEVAGRLMELFERSEAKKAEREFAAAFSELQAEMPAIKATKAVPNNDGSIRYKFAPYEEIMKQVQPILTKHGFSVRFSSKSEEGKMTMICTLMHKGGHSVTNEFAVRIGKGPPGSNEAQADGSAGSYAQRAAICDALNISVRHDDDARAVGHPITPEQAKSLRDRVLATGSNEDAFLAYAQVRLADNATAEDRKKAYLEIPSTMYALLDQNLRRKEKTTA